MAHKKKKRHAGFETSTLSAQAQRPTCQPTLCLLYVDPDWYVLIHTNRRLGSANILTKKGKQHLWPGDDASTAEAAPDIVRRDEQR